MLDIIIVSTDQSWHAPMVALLVQRDLKVEVAADALDTLILLRADPPPELIIGPEVDEGDLLTVVEAAWRRYGDRFKPHIVGPLRGLALEDAAKPLFHYASPFSFLEISRAITPIEREPEPTPAPTMPTRAAAAQNVSDQLTPSEPPLDIEPVAVEQAQGPYRGGPLGSARAASAIELVEPRAKRAYIADSDWVSIPAAKATADTSLIDSLEPEDLQPVDIDRLYALAIKESYYMLLGLRPESGLAEIEGAIDSLLLLTEPETLDPYVYASSRDALTEIRAALLDARLVLTSPAARRCYDHSLSKARALAPANQRRLT